MFDAVVCKTQASKHYIVSLPSVLKDKRSCFSQGAVHSCLLFLHSSEVEHLIDICDPLSENPALHANIEFELEVILSVQVVFQLNSDYCTKVLQGACTVSY